MDVRTINEHILNILKTDELAEKATIRNFRIVQKEGKREVNREVKHYNLDMILSVGYRINSRKATLFRQWATKTLRGYIIDLYTRQDLVQRPSTRLFFCHHKVDMKACYC